MNTQPQSADQDLRVFAYHEFDDTPRPFDAGRLVVHLGDICLPLMTYVPVEQYNQGQKADEPHLSLLFRWAVILHHYGLGESRVQGVAGTLDDLFFVTNQWAMWCLRGVLDLYVQRRVESVLTEMFNDLPPYTLTALE